MMNLFKNILIFAIYFITAGCANSGKEISNIKNITDPNILYQSGMENIEKKKYNDAISYFEAIEDNHVDSELIIPANIQMIYASYLQENYEGMKSYIKKFTKYYAWHKASPYVYYMDAMSEYAQIYGVQRDISHAHKTMKKLEVIIKKYPKSEYASDAKIKRDYAFNVLAGKEVDTGRFYMNDHKYIAALKRFHYVVDYYEKSVFVEEALFRLVEIYKILHLEEQAKHYAAILDHNYKDSIWYEKTYNKFQ